jgi:hypothetical protein
MKDPSLQHDSCLTRRGLLALAATAGAGRLYAASDFWNKKDPKDWTRDEVDRLLSNSPWAKQVSAPFPRNGRGGQAGGGYPGGGQTGGRYPGGGYPGGGYPGGGYPGGGYPGGGYPGGGVGRPGIGLGIPGIGGLGYPRGGRRRESEQVKGTVRWQSAEPIMAALNEPLPAAFAHHYVISVSGFPWPPDGSYGRDSYPDDNDRSSSSRSGDEQQDDELLDQLKSVTYLQPSKGRSAQPGIVRKPVTSQGTLLLFGFSQELVDVSPDDKDVLFTTHLDRAVIQAKFNIKEMKYSGKLAV